jgi:hypothetical protein
MACDGGGAFGPCRGGLRCPNGRLDQSSVTSRYDRAKADPGAQAELQHFLELENEEEAAFSALLAVTPTTKAAAPSPAFSTSQNAASRPTRGAPGSRCSSHRRWPCDRGDDD